jgi:hypothetical protein
MSKGSVLQKRRQRTEVYSEEICGGELGGIYNLSTKTRKSIERIAMQL